MRILVIEDEKRIASFIKRGLQEEKYTVDIAYEGEEGLFLAETNDYDLVVLDIMLPDKNGFYIGFVPDTIKAFEKCGMKFYNEAILLNAIASASMRANGNMKSQKLVKVHQNILVFKKI